MAVILVQPSANPDRDRSRELGRSQAPCLTVFGNVLDERYRTLVPMLESLVADGSARLRYAHFVETRITEGPRHLEIALALEAAGRQGAFWPYHRLLLTGFVSINRAGLLHRARFLGLDLGRFQRDGRSVEAAGAIAQDTAHARGLGVERLPALLLGGRPYEGRLQRGELIDALRAQ